MSVKRKKVSSQSAKPNKTPKRPRRGKTTVDTAPKVGSSRTTMPSSSSPKLPPEKRPANSPVKIQYPRERRMNPDGRRGRYAEKAPPGTRTKMLKIIYDRKAEMARKRNHALIGKLVIASILCAFLFYGTQHIVTMADTGVKAVIEIMNLPEWWQSVSAPTAAQRQTRVPQTQLRRIAPVKKRHASSVHKQAGTPKRYGLTRAYQGKAKARSR